LSDGSVNLIDTSHPESPVTEHFSIFKNLPLAGADTSMYERILGNGLNTRVIAIVNHKYVYSWKWSETGCCLRISLTNIPVNCVYLFHYQEEETMFTKKRAATPPPPPPVPPVEGKKVGSSLVAPGLNVFAGGATTVSCRPLSEFVFTIDEMFHEPDVLTIDYCYAEAAIFCGFRSGKVRMISLSLPRQFTEYHTEDFAVFQVLTFETLGFSLSSDYSICLWKLGDDALDLIQKRERAHDCEISCAAFCPPKRQLITCDVKGFCRLWAVKEEKEFKEQLLLDHSYYGPVTSCCYSASGNVWLCASHDNFVRAWPVANPLQPATFQFCVSPCTITALAPGLDNDVYIATDDRTIRLINMQRSDERGLFLGHTQLVRQISVSGTAGKWISLQWDGQLYFWLANLSAKVSATASAPAPTSRLPRLLQRADASRSLSSTGDEPLISLYEKSRKTLLMKRRDGERQLKKMKQSTQWRKLAQIQQAITTAVSEKQAELDANKATQTV
jgi:hypothetical protein